FAGHWGQRLLWMRLRVKGWPPLQARQHVIRRQRFPGPCAGVVLQRKDRGLMTHTVCQPCYDCKYTDCVAVCPVECFWQDDMMLYIDPEDCIDCEACGRGCPVEAIFAEANVPAQWTSFTPLNAEKAGALKAASEGHITEKGDAKEG